MAAPFVTAVESLSLFLGKKTGLRNVVLMLLEGAVEKLG